MEDSGNSFGNKNSTSIVRGVVESPFSEDFFELFAVYCGKARATAVAYSR